MRRLPVHPRAHSIRGSKLGSGLNVGADSRRFTLHRAGAHAEDRGWPCRTSAASPSSASCSAPRSGRSTRAASARRVRRRDPERCPTRRIPAGLAWRRWSKAPDRHPARRLIMPWNRSMRSRATTSAGMAPSMIAIVRATVLNSRPRSVVIMRAIALADGTLRGRAVPVAVRSSFRLLVAHSAITRSPPAKPANFARRYDAAPFRQPVAQSSSAASGTGPVKTTCCGRYLCGRRAPFGAPARVTCRCAARRSWLRLVLAPLAVSRNTWRAPAARSARTWASTLCPSVDTLS